MFFLTAYIDCPYDVINLKWHKMNVFMSALGVLPILAVMAAATELATENSTITTPVLTPDAIANITTTVLAIILLTSIVCYLLMCYEKKERMDRVRLALEKNRAIEKQMVASKARQSRERERAESGASIFSASHSSAQPHGTAPLPGNV